jgi:hypothetical protein
VNNDGSPVENGTLYTVEVDRGQVVSSDADTGRTGTQVAVQEGELAFEVQSDSVAGSSKVLARSVYGKATSEATITFQDTGAPAAVSIESAEAGDSRARLAWSPSSSPDVAGYKVYFGRDPDRLEGVAARGIQSPVDIGSSQQATLRGLVNDSTYHVAIAAYDVNGTESELSTLASVAPVDTVAPGPLSDLRPTMQADTTATLAWTAPGDNGNAGLAYAYEVRYTTAPVMDDTSAWWDEATPAAVNQPPSEAGASESVSIRGSFAGEVYYGVRTTDEVGNVSSVTITSTSELPVELTRFDASVKGQQVVLLQWETASEDGNAGFEVQRRMEDSSFERVGYVEGAGTTNSMRSYQFEDADIPFDVEAVTYRLRQVDLDGTFEYSPEVEVTLDAPEELAIHGNYPNPFHQRTKIRYELPRAGDVRIDVYNVLGQRVATLVNERQQAGREEITFDARRLASGVYFVRLRSLGESLTEKITVVR